MKTRNKREKYKDWIQDRFQSSPDFELDGMYDECMMYVVDCMSLSCWLCHVEYVMLLVDHDGCWIMDVDDDDDDDDDGGICYDESFMDV